MTGGICDLNGMRIYAAGMVMSGRRPTSYWVDRPSWHQTPATSIRYY